MMNTMNLTNTMNMTGGIPWELASVLPWGIGDGAVSVRQYRVGTGLWTLPNSTMQLQAVTLGTNDSSGWVDVSSIAGGVLRGSWYAPVLYGW